jgi:hypothetical protein
MKNHGIKQWVMVEKIKVQKINFNSDTQSLDTKKVIISHKATFHLELHVSLERPTS